MLSYRHGFHAGGWADVHKHVAFALLLSHLCRKPAPFSLLDAFAGDAIYDLAGPEAVKTGEFEAGIAKLFHAADAPAELAPYLAAVRAANPEGMLRRYPGSPALASAIMREEDSLILNELHPTAYRALAAWAARDPRIAIHKRDATEFLGAFATPKLRRGAVLIDPAYEVKTEYETVPRALVRAIKNWPQGIYALWYPVLAEARHRGLLTSVRNALIEKPQVEAIVTEIAPPMPAAEPARGMRGSGLVVINAPWRFCDEMKTAGSWLARRLWQPDQGRHLLWRLGRESEAD